MAPGSAAVLPVFASAVPVPGRIGGPQSSSAMAASAAAAVLLQSHCCCCCCCERPLQLALAQEAWLQLSPAWRLCEVTVFKTLSAYCGGNSSSSPRWIYHLYALQVRSYVTHAGNTAASLPGFGRISLSHTGQVPGQQRANLAVRLTQLCIAGQCIYIHANQLDRRKQTWSAKSGV